MKNNKLNFSQFSKKMNSLSNKHQKAIKGGAKQAVSFISPNISRWIEVDIRKPNPVGRGTGEVKPHSFLKTG